MLGGFENGGDPRKEDESLVLSPEDSSSPINATFEGKDFTFTDEVFQMKDSFSHDRLRILLTINEKKTDFLNPKILAHILSGVFVYAGSG